MFRLASRRWPRLGRLSRTPDDISHGADVLIDLARGANVLSAPSHGSPVAGFTAGGDLAGYAHLAPHSSMPVNAHVLHLNAIVVAPRHRGEGIDRALVEAATQRARQLGKRKLGLRVLGSNARAIQLYERAGFVLEGRLRDEFLLADGRYEDDLWYALDLTRVS